MRLSIPRFPIVILVAALLGAILPGCSTSAHAPDLNMIPLDKLPGEVQSAPVSVRTAYQFAAANPNLMKSIPCYCGCGQIGHTSNYSCYVAAVGANGSITYDEHALGCSLCVQITEDTSRLSRQGKAASEIRAYVDATYAKYGTSNMP